MAVKPLTREELDNLELLYREDFGSPEHEEFVTLMHESWHALIAQARRCIELEERIREKAERFAGQDGIKVNGPFLSNLLLGVLKE